MLYEVAEAAPLLCLVDDEQWLDRASAQVLPFVARRLGAESLGIVFAARTASEELTGPREIVVEGLGDEDAHALLESVLTGPVDPIVRDQIIKETQDNPLALLQLPRRVTPAEPAGEFTVPAVMALAVRIEESFRRRVDALPAESRRLLQLAAADPVGQASLLWQAAERLGIRPCAGTAAVEAELIELVSRVQFRHPLVRSAAYLSGSEQARREAHRVLAEVTDPQLDPDRRAWHRAGNCRT
ncbi:MAG TPA: hypothetical protein VFT31_02905 [Kribbella sp.]|nr:hypothetical protein [Kribbella sp.]